MKKILLILFVLIFNFSYSTTNTETEDIFLQKEFQEKILRQSDSFSKCFKTAVRDLEEMDSLLEKFIKMTEEIMNTSKGFSPDILKNKKERNKLFNKFDEILEITELLESRIDHLYYFHASEISSDIDAQLLTFKKQLLEINAFCRNYKSYIAIYYN